MAIIICFSDNVRQCNVTGSVVHVLYSVALLQLPSSVAVFSGLLKSSFLTLFSITTEPNYC